MAVTYLTLYLPGSNQPVQVIEGSHLHVIYAQMGASAIPGTTPPTRRPDPFPYYIDEDELAAALAGGGGGGASDASVAALIDDAGSQTRARLGAALVPRAPHGLTVALGDSHTQMNATAQDSFDSYHLWAAAYLGGQMRLVYNAGVAGQTSTQILARVQADVIDKLPNGGTCLIMWGTNDVGEGLPLATTQANTSALVAMLRPRGIEPIFFTIPPRGNDITAPAAGQMLATSRINQWLLAYCTLAGVRCIDLASVVTDPATGMWISNYSDVPGVHGLPRAQVLMGRYVADQLAGYFSATPPYRALSNVDPLNLLPNGLFANNDGTLPTGWTKENGSAATTTVGDVAGFRGKALTVTGALPSAKAIFGAPQITSGFSVGDRIAWSYRYASSGLANAGRSFPLGMRLIPTYSWARRNLLEADTDPVLFYDEFTVPVGTTALWFVLETGDTGTAVATPSITLGEMTIRNLTTSQLMTA